MEVDLPRVAEMTTTVTITTAAGFARFNRPAPGRAAIVATRIQCKSEPSRYKDTKKDKEPVIRRFRRRTQILKVKSAKSA